MKMDERRKNENGWKEYWKKNSTVKMKLTSWIWLKNSYITIIKYYLLENCTQLCNKKNYHWPQWLDGKTYLWYDSW